MQQIPYAAPVPVALEPFNDCAIDIKDHAFWFALIYVVKWAIPAMAVARGDGLQVDYLG